MEKEENLVRSIEKLDKYFFSPSAASAPSLIFKHVETMHEHLSRAFPIDPLVLAQLQKSLLRISKLGDASVASEVKDACQQLAVRLGTFAFNYRIHEER